ncbi:hypothetical protein [Bradyrhizobium embrapense]
MTDVDHSSRAGLIKQELEVLLPLRAEAEALAEIMRIGHRAPADRHPPTEAVIDEWLIIKPRVGRIDWAQDVYPAVRNPLRQQVLKRGTRAWTFWRKVTHVTRFSDGLGRLTTDRIYPKFSRPVILIPGELYVQASHVIWLKTHGAYPERTISPINGQHGDLRACNWDYTDVVMAQRRQTKKNRRQGALKREAARREARMGGSR